MWIDGEYFLSPFVTLRIEQGIIASKAIIAIAGNILESLEAGNPGLYARCHGASDYFSYEVSAGRPLPARRLDAEDDEEDESNVR